RAIGGNRLEHPTDSPRALEVMLELIAQARRWVHFENYIIRDDRTGRRFAAALAERARAGVAVRVLYDALGSLGTSRRYWRGLRQAGAEVRAFHPILSRRPFRIIQRDHRKLLVTDGTQAMVGGLCIGDEWAGDPRRLPRRTGAALCRPARRRPRRRRRPPPRPGHERSSGVAQLHARRLPRAVAGGGAHLRVSRSDGPRQDDAGRPPLGPRRLDQPQRLEPADELRARSGGGVRAP